MEPKNITIGLLTLSSENELTPLVERIQKAMGSMSNVKYLQLTRDMMNGHISFGRYKFDAVVLIHSAKDGRFSLTDVRDAKYNILLPKLREEFGVNCVGLIVYSVPGINDNTRQVKLDGLKFRQKTAGECSRIIILCESLSDICETEWNSLCQFLRKSPNKNLPPMMPMVQLAQGSRMYNMFIVGREEVFATCIRDAIINQVRPTDMNFTLKELVQLTQLPSKDFQGAALVITSEDDAKEFTTKICEVFAGYIKHNREYLRVVRPAGTEYNLYAGFELEILEYRVTQDNHFYFEERDVANILQWFDKCRPSSKRSLTACHLL